jgi:signal transduction histidine kinase
MSSSLPFNSITPPSRSLTLQSEGRERAAGSSPPVAALSGLRGGRFWVLFLIMAGALGLFLFALLSTAMERRQELSEAGQILCLLSLMTCSLWVSARSPRGQARWAWRCIGIAFATYTAAEAIFGYLSIAFQNNPTPSLADPFYLAFYPLMATGLILLPQAPLHRAERLRAVVDGAIIAGALLGLSFFYLIGPTYIAGATTPLALYVLVAYPVGDFVLVATLAVLAVRGVQTAYRPVFLLLTVGMLFFIYADSAFDYLSLKNVYAPGTLSVDPFWVAGELLMLLAPLYLLVHGDQAEAGQGWLSRITLGRFAILRGGLGRLVIPYMPVAVLFVLLWVNQPPVAVKSFYPALEILALLVVLLIITRQVLTVRELLASQAATVRAQQLDSLKDQFITSVNHELRTPIMTMQGYIELLGELQNQVDAAERTSMLVRARQANEALVHLVQSILDTRRIDQGADDFAPEPVPLHSALHAAAAITNPNHGNVPLRELVVEVPEDIVIWGEPIRLEQVLINLLSNAVKYSAPGTPVEVTAQVARETRSPVWSWRRDTSQKRPIVELTVHDHGLGIPPDQIPLLFRRFVRLPRDLGSRTLGTGLGLYLCRVYVEAMGGTIWVESTGIAGQGSTFHVRLPLASRVRMAASRALSVPATAATSRSR